MALKFNRIVMNYFIIGAFIMKMNHFLVMGIGTVIVRSLCTSFISVDLKSSMTPSQ